MSDRVSVSTQAGVADVRMNRADKLNALDTAMFAALIETGRSLATDSSVRAVVLSGEGRAFCAGLDVSSFAAMADRDARGPKLFDRSDESPANFAQRAAWVWTELPVPVIAAVHGVAFGGGLQVALAADIRLVAPDARLSVMEVKWARRGQGAHLHGSDRLGQRSLRARAGHPRERRASRSGAGARP
jgi:enoyl-CoA hydratase/carnithine racemase